MEQEFWLDRWRANEIGFHQAHVHPLLVAHWNAIAPSAGQRVLVPLCGKSLDLCWLAARGFEVVGFELSVVAVTAFFDEQGLSPEVREEGAFKVFSAGSITLYCGDFTHATGSCAPCSAVYDRAALIALRPLQRPKYLDTVRRLCHPHAQGLLITVEYGEGAIVAPPFSVEAAEVRSLYQGWSKIEEIDRRTSQVKGQDALEVAFKFRLADDYV